MQDQNIDSPTHTHTHSASYRCAIGDTAAGVHRAEASAAQHGSHLVNLFKWLLLHFDCNFFLKKNKCDKSRDCEHAIYDPNTAADERASLC